MALRILLADDSMTAQNMGKKILTDAGFEVVTVSNGAAAVKKLAEATPDIAILDVYMPGYTGLEVCERLKSAPATARVPVLLSVGKMEPFRPEEGMKVKADGVIIKPFEATDLVTVVDKLAERSYGPDAKSTGVVPPLPPPPAAEPEPAREENVLDEPAPAREGQAEGLETFTPVATSAASMQPEAGVEFTSEPKTGAVEDEPLQDLVPTVLPPEASDAPLEVAAPEIEPVQPVEASAIEEVPQVKAAAAAASVAPAVATEAIAQTVVEEAPVADEMVADPLPELETSVPEFAAAEPVVATAAPAEDWTAVEAEIVDPDASLDLEAEMMAAETELDDPIATESIAPVQEQPASVTVAAMPFLSPMGKTSFDELDAVIASVEETSASSQLEGVEALPESAAELVAQEDVLLDEQPMAAPVVEPEPEPVVQAVEESVGEVPVAEVPVAEVALLDVAEPAMADTTEPEGLLDVAPAHSGAPVEETSTEKDALAFYGLSDLGDEPLRNPIDEADEPFFSIPDVTEPQAATVEQSPSTADVLDEIAVEPVSDELDVFGTETPVAEAPVLEEPVVEEPSVEEPIVEQTTDTIALQPLVEEAPIIGEDAILEPCDSEESLITEVPELAPAALAAAAAPMVAAVVQSESEAIAPAPQAVATDETVVNAMVGRVVDRVVDRLKPVLTIMVEEILKEVKKK